MATFCMNRTQKEALQDRDTLAGKLKYICSSPRTALFQLHVKLGPWVLVLTLGALLLICRYEIPSSQFRAWHGQLFSYICGGQIREPFLPGAKVHGKNSSTMQTGLNTATPNFHVAVCLVGGARAFELTGPSIKQYLLQANNNTDIFLHAPLDKDAYKFSLLKDLPQLVTVRIFSPIQISETPMHAEVLTANGSPNGVQGLLQYFKLVEGCLPIIEEHQLKHNFTYDWIVRSRVDGYWNKPLPSLQNFKPEIYTVPYGSQFGGLNDRLGLGNWKTSKVALARFATLQVLHAHGLRNLNSERAFKRQIEVGHVKYGFGHFLFCVLSHRIYEWPPGIWGVPVVSILSEGPLNGAKCRPCTPVATGAMAKSILKAQERHWAWIGSATGPELCDPRHGWETNWEDILDKTAGQEFANGRKKVAHETLADCIKVNEEFQMQVKNWDAPSPRKVCEKGGFSLS